MRSLESIEERGKRDVEVTGKEKSAETLESDKGNLSGLWTKRKLKILEQGGRDEGEEVEWRKTSRRLSS